MISVCLIVKNEEPWMKECLSHLSGFADEIVVVDTGSIDRTLEIVRGFPQVKLFQFEWIDDFGAARNFALEKATQPWVFSFDADERIAKKDMAEFRRVIGEINSRPEIEAISLVRRDYVRNPAISGFKPSKGEYAAEEKNLPGFYLERMVRIFRRAPHIRWVGKLHEMVDSTLKGSILESDLTFHHYGFLPEEEARKKKKKFYEEQGFRKIQENPLNWKAHFDLGCELVQTGKLLKAKEAFEKADRLFPRQPLVLANWGYALMELKEFERAEAVLTQSRAAEPRHHDTLLNLAVTFMRQQKFAEAAKVLVEALQYHATSFTMIRNLGLCFLHLKQFQKATHCFQEALRHFPAFSEARLDLGISFLMLGNSKEARKHFETVLEAEPANPRALELLQAAKQESSRNR